MNEQSVRGIWVLRWRFVAIGFASMLAVVLALLHGADVQAAEVESSPRVKLFRPDSLIGWNYGPTPPTGWTIEGGVLHGDQKASQLNSAWTFGDFDLAFAWTASDDGVWEIVLPMLHIEGQPPAGIDSAVRILLKGKRDIEMLAPGAAASGSFAANHDGPFKTTIRRSGKTLTVQIGDGATFEVSVDPKVRLGLALKLSSGSGLLQNLTLSEPAGEAIFNGRDLAGWWTPGNRESWKVEDAQIVCLNNGGNYLRSEKEFGNFTLSLDYKMNKSVNSGVGIRTPRAGWPSSDGIEIQLEDKPGLDKHATMALYGNLEPLARADKSRQWNHAVVKAEGHIVTGWMNGELVQHSDTSTLAELKHRQLTGWIGLQDHGGRIWVRNMNVLEAPPGENPMLVGRPAYVPTQSERVLERLMNSHVLAQHDGLKSVVVQGQLAATDTSNSSAAAHVLADLAGPGCLVSLWQQRDGGRLAFYFDGQESPQFSSSFAELPWHVPHIGEDASPRLTCVPFSKSLKIVRTGGPETEYRAEYVRFDAMESASQYALPSLDIPRGALSAVDYRYHRLGGGTLRDLDPYDRLNAELRVIEPVSSSQLLSTDGAGTLLWLKLIADTRLLDNDDLWLEMTVDGERQPAISAPARFWFPALVGGANHDNFTQVSRDGFTTLLAMPFARGMTIAVRNTGVKPIQGIGAAACVQTKITSPMRLRGVFHRALLGEPTAMSGRGRWIGLVSATRQDAAPAIGELVVDGKAATGWNQTSAAQFWGAAAGENEIYTALAGHAHGLAWRYLLLAPVEFQQSFKLKQTAGETTVKRLALFYVDAKQ